MAKSLKHELADHIYQYLCHEAQYSDLPEASKESLTAASECIEQAYKLNVGTSPHYQNTSTPTSSAKHQSTEAGGQHYKRSSDILPDELLRIFTRHKEFLSQQKDSLIYPLRNNSNDEQAASTSTDKPDIRANSNSLQQQASNSSNDHQNSTNNPNMSPTFNHNNNNNNNGNSSNAIPNTAQQISTSNNPHQQALTATATAASSKPHNQHPISQLPMTTRKKLSHLRAQIKRQASKAARSRLEKRSSVSGVANSSGDKPGHHFGISFDANSSKLTGDYHHKELHNQPNSSSSTESPHAHSSNQTTSSPVTSGSNNQDTNTNMNLSPTQLQNDGGPSGLSGGSSGLKLIGQQSLSVTGHNSNNQHSIHQKNFKQKIIALLKKFRTDGSDFDSEEQYREALERELMKAAAGRGSRAIEELLEEDIDVEEESVSETEDWDNISESSTPKPSLRPFFSSTTLDKI